ncbi:MAG TPA: YkgJ family cysteine cluster protein, partial [Candidatus Binatia bacterium]
MTEDATAKSMLPIKLSAAGWSIDTKVSVPSGSTRIGDLLPLARTLSQSLVESSIQSVAEDGRKISCTKGCGACCRQLVAIPFAEAQTLAELVAAMPVERQAIIQARFDAAITRLEDAGLMDRKEAPGERALIANDCGSRAASLQDLSQRYFRLQIPCPFLENESCGIYDDRPLVCREYHVTSPAQQCARLFDQPVDRVEVPIHLGDVISRTGAESSRTAADSIPLVLALEWVKKNHESCEQRWNSETLWQTFVDELHTATEAASLRPSGDGAKFAIQPAPSFSAAPLIVTKFPDPQGNANADWQTVKLSLLDSNWQLQTTLAVPVQSTDAAEFLPLARTIVDSVVDHAVSSVETNGQKISCKAGCGACCRQLVPISAVEATKMRELIEAMPEPRRADVRARFA